MSNILTIQSLNKTDNDLFISGNVIAMNPMSLLIQLTDEQGQSIPCDIRTSTDRENDETSFALNAQIESNAIVFLYVSDKDQSVQLRIDPSFIRKQKRTELFRKINPRNFKKAAKFFREYGPKNTVLRMNREVRKKDTPEVDYNIWKKFFDPTEAELERQRDSWKNFTFETGKAPLISIVIPAYNTDRQMLLLLLDSLRAQTYPVFEVLIADGSSEDNHTVKDTLDSYSQSDPRFTYIPVEGNHGISGNTNAGLSRVNGDFVAFCDHDDALPPWALFEIIKAISENPRVQFLYTDEDKVDIDGVTFFDPHFKSDYNLFLLETCNYISHFNVVRKDLLDQAGFLGSDYDGAQDFDFVLRCSDVFNKEEWVRLERFRGALTETTDVAELSARSSLLEESVQKLLEGRFISELAVHIPKVCYHWRCSQNSTAFDSRSKMYAYEAGCKAVRDHHLRVHTQFQEVVNSRNFGFYRTLYSNDAKTAPKISVVIMNQDHPQLLDRCVQALRASGYPDLEILPVAGDPEGQKTKTELWNSVIERVSGEYVLLLDNSLILKDNNSLYEMAGYLNRTNVGAVGARLLNKSGAIWSAGQIINEQELAVPAFRGLYEYEGSYMHRMMCSQNYSSLDVECMLVRSSLLKQLSGFDTAFHGDLAGTDLCLRIRQLGYLLAYTPYALFEKQSAAAEQEETADSLTADQAYFRKKWQGFLEHTDPYYNPQFLPDEAGFYIGIHPNEEKE